MKLVFISALLVAANAASAAAHPESCKSRLTEILLPNDYVNKQALTERCLEQTRRSLIAPSANYGGRSAQLLVDAEVRLGLIELARGHSESTNHWWNEAVRDQSHAGYWGPTDFIPNRGLRLFGSGSYSQAFAWFADTYAQYKTAEDPSLIDGGYYRFLASGLKSASVGKYDDAISSFDRSIALSSDGSDAFFYRGVALSSATRSGERRPQLGDWNR